MILAICPNPCVDVTIELDFLNVGRMNRIRNKQETYAGKALNVAVSVERLGGESFLTGFMYEGNGRQFVSCCTKENVKNEFVWSDGLARVNYKIIDNKSMMTEINDKGEKVSLEKQEELIKLVAEKSKNCSVAVMSGSLPQNVGDDYYAKLCSAIESNVKKIVDTEGEALIKAVKTGVYLIKPNLEEMERTVGKRLETVNEMLEACKYMINLGAENVLLSLGRKGAILTNGQKSYFCKSASVAVNSTVGAGDSMVAAACIQIEKGKDLPEILKCAVAGGTASVTTPGTGLVYLDKYNEILDKLVVEEL